MENAGKLRLLLTARDRSAADSIISVKRECYLIETLPKTEAEELIKKVLDVNDKQLDPRQMDEIVNICGGVPKLLTVVAGFIGCEENPQEAFLTVKEAWENNWKGKIGDHIEQYVFACNKVEKDLREAFLDICSFFQGWDWEELSNIVGKPALDSLQKRALVSLSVLKMVLQRFV